MQVLSRFEKDMKGMGRFSLKVKDATTLKDAGSVTVTRSLTDSDCSQWVRVLVEKERLSAETDE